MSGAWTPERARDYARERYRANRVLVDRACVGCGKAIPTEAHGRRKFCARECRDNWDLVQRRARTRANRTGRICERCGTDISPDRSPKATTCSTKCRDALDEAKLMRIKCRALSHYAVKVGRLVKQPCEVCGNENVEIHHIDYFDPLTVRWLCFVHHRNLMHGTSIEEGATRG